MGHPFNYIGDSSFGSIALLTLTAAAFVIGRVTRRRTLSVLALVGATFALFTFVFFENANVTGGAFGLSVGFAVAAAIAMALFVAWAWRAIPRRGALQSKYGWAETAFASAGMGLTGLLAATAAAIAFNDQNYNSTMIAPLIDVENVFQWVTIVALGLLITALVYGWVWCRKPSQGSLH